MASPGGSPQSAGSPGPTAEMIFGQILQQMQAGMSQMSQESNRRFELLEAALQEQVTTERVTAEAQVRAFEAMTKKSNVVDIKGVGKPELLKGSNEDARKVWKTWSYKFESWFSSQFPAKGQECLDWARNKGDETIQEPTLTEYVNKVPEAMGVDRQLHVALISLTSEMPYTVVFNARKRCGLDAWRRLAMCTNRTMLGPTCASCGASWCSPVPLWSSCAPPSTGGRQTLLNTFSEETKISKTRRRLQSF